MFIEWKPEQLDRTKAVYLAIADAIEADIASGTLRSGAPLPPQRKLAKELSVDFTTVTRAYAEARKRGLIEGRIGKGTFVKGLMKEQTLLNGFVKNMEVDMGMNMPPVATDQTLIARLHLEMAEVSHRINTRTLFGYHDFIGSLSERELVSKWLGGFVSNVSPDRLIICPGTQSALLSIALYLFKPGDYVVSEELCYPGFRILMRQLGINHLGAEMDEEGIIPSSLRKLCQDHTVKALYCNPTLHNPTTLTWSKERRIAIANIAREFNLKIIEDDAYRALATDGPAPLSDFAPERSFYIFGLAKCVLNALRLSFLVIPSLKDFQGITLSLRGSAMMPSPITKAIALQLISSGCADQVTSHIRKEGSERQRLAKEILPREYYSADTRGFHGWLSLLEGCLMNTFKERMRIHGIRLVGADAFSVNSKNVQAVRLCLGAPATLEETHRVLMTTKDILLRPADFEEVSEIV